MNRKYCSGALDLQDISENIKWHTKNILEAERQAPQVTECNTVQSLGIWVFNLKNLSKSESSMLLWIDPRDKGGISCENWSIMH